MVDMHVYVSRSVSRYVSRSGGCQKVSALVISPS